MSNIRQLQLGSKQLFEFNVPTELLRLESLVSSQYWPEWPLEHSPRKERKEAGLDTARYLGLDRKEIVTEFLVAVAVLETGAAVVAGDLLGGHVACVALIAGEARVALEESWIRSRKDW
jgi:hypothetical protein